jgi:amino acid adenylation domain-containing protein/non-ribosomal peptide synthase protein (TIGR01720 family)
MYLGEENQLKEKKRFPLTQAQRRIWNMELMHPQTAISTIAGSLVIKGQIHITTMKQAIKRLLDEHDVFRIKVGLYEEQPCQWIEEEIIAPEIQVVEFNERNEAEKWLNEYHKTPIFISSHLLYEFILFDINREEYWVNVKINHIICDGISMHLMSHFLMEHYIDIMNDAQTVKKTTTYIDYIYSEQEYEKSERYKKNTSYWLEKYQTLPQITGIKPYPPYSISTAAKRMTIPLKNEKYFALKQFCEQHAVSVYTFFMTALYLLSHKITGSQDVSLGTIYANRTSKHEKEAIGMFVSTVAARLSVEPEQDLLSLLQKVGKEQRTNLRHQRYPYNKLIQNLREKMKLDDIQDLFGVSVEYRPVSWIRYDQLAFQIRNGFCGHEIDDLLLRIEEMIEEQEIVLHFDYRTQLFEEHEMKRVIKQLLAIFDHMLLNPQSLIKEISILDQEEKNKILMEFHKTSDECFVRRTVDQLFEEQVERTPESVAIVYEDRYITYGELDECSNRLARTLRANGVQSDQLIGVLVERSPEMVVSVLAILKAGGAYVPIDPDYPEERIAYMLKDSKTRVLISQCKLAHKVAFSGTWIMVDDESSYDADSTALVKVHGNENLAYVIYTSGTTGKPKGVMIEHKQLAAMASAWKSEYRLNRQGVRWLQWASFSFDVFTGDLARALLHGGQLVICPSEARVDPAQLHAIIAKYEIEMFESTPALIVPLMEYVQENGLEVPSLKLLILGSDYCPVEEYNKLVQRYGKKMRIVNSYGVTEACIDACYFEQNEEPLTGTLPIGKPLPDVSMFILNEYRRLQPIGIEGELFIGGSGVGRGYWNQPELTAERFVDNPYKPGERMYRTGDLAKWLPDGNIAYLGRVDHQVKIRGYRIEAGEIESQLLQIEGIREAVVVAREEDSGHRILCAYFVAMRELEISKLRESLSLTLPGYMVPSYFMKLDSLPLTPNGKVDRQGLPAPAYDLNSGKMYISPRTKVESTLAQVWKKVLNPRTEVGVLDNFFELGGDSIKSLQVISNMRRFGCKLEVKDLFAYPTIAQLAMHVVEVEGEVDQREITGDALLTPIQRWFFDMKFTDQHHYNQSVMLYRKEGFDDKTLRHALEMLIQHHDALRMVFHETAGGYKARNRSSKEGILYSLEAVHIADHDHVVSEMDMKANEIQASMDLQNGPLVKTILFHTVNGDHLLIVIHHIVVDGVSWRILLEDLMLGYEQTFKGESIRLPSKTDSYQAWAEHLVSYAQNGFTGEEKKYWQRIVSEDVKPLPKDWNVEQARQYDSEVMYVQLSVENTERLLKAVHRAYRTEINDILLTSLGMALHEWIGERRFLINVEGHGRENIHTKLDITRTVGWFTSEFPVMLEINEGAALQHIIKQIKEMLRQVPNKGIGYGIYRYLINADKPMNSHLNSQPEISFNYLGEFDHDLHHLGIELSSYETGDSISGKQERPYAIDINGSVHGGALSLKLSYSRTQFRTESIERLTGLWLEKLEAIILHCCEQRRSELTPSDVLLDGISISELDELSKMLESLGEISNVYELTPMQKGMWFHYSMAPDSGAYIEQTQFIIKGELQLDAFAKSWEELTQNHCVLRTNFFKDWNGEPIQIVYRDKQVAYSFQDLRGMSKLLHKEYIESYVKEDKNKGFDLEKGSLMRVSVIRSDEEEYVVLWSFHHILMDGWCMPLIAKEVFSRYASIVQSVPHTATAPPLYSEYLQWLKAQDDNAASAYWEQYLAGYTGHTLLLKPNIPQQANGYSPQELTLKMDKYMSEKVNVATQQHQVTLYTFIQTVWGIVLQNYNRSNDVVFGGVVSGRPSVISGIEEMIGLFINTVPIRISCSPEDTFADLARKLQAEALESAKYDYYPLYEIQSRSIQKQDLITHILVFENYPMEDQLGSSATIGDLGLTISDVVVVEQTNYDFNLTVIPGEEVIIRFEYNANVYEEKAMNRLVGHVQHVIEQAIANPNTKIGEFEILTVIEKNEMLHGCINVVDDNSLGKTVEQLFKQQAERTPEAVAVAYEEQYVTYRELDERSNQLARTLRAQGVRSDQLVGVLLERIPEMIVSVLAVMKAGGAYVPIDPDYPEERIVYMLKDSKAKVLLSQRKLAHKVAFAGVWIMVDDESSYDADSTVPEREHGNENMAYVIYTSGTTGKPKGVMIEHKQLAAMASAWGSEYRLNRPGVRWLQWASFSFDVFTGDLVRALLHGGQLVICPSEARVDPAQLHAMIKKYEIEMFESTPALIVPLMDYVHENGLEVPSLKLLILGSDHCPVEEYNKLVQRYGKLMRIVNSYGVTEACIDACYFEQNEEPVTGVLPIGKPLPDVSMFILNEQRRLQPIGIEGELFIGGLGVGRGYWNQPELTAERFVDNPYRPGERMYRTGDLAKRLPDGNIAYLGRLDHQVKIRGYRIETGEIESQLLQIEGIREAVVVAREEESGQKVLCAYFTAIREIEAGDVRESLSSELPSYMMPTYIMQVSHLPLTPNGKVDKNALSMPEPHLLKREFVAPANEVEEELAIIWQEVLALKEVSVTSDFFELGGHSLKAASVISRIKKQFQVNLLFQDFFKKPTIRGISSYLQNRDSHYEIVEQASHKEYYMASSAQKRMYVLQLLNPASVGYNMAASFLIEGNLDPVKLESSFRALLLRHEALRTYFSIEDGDIVQRIVADAEFIIPYTEDSDINVEIELKRFVKPFDLSQAPLMRAKVIKLENGHLLLFDIHHIICDEVSIDILIEDLMSFYTDKSLETLTYQYKDYAEWQHQFTQTNKFAAQRDYWNSIFSEEPPVLNMPTDYTRPSVRSYDGEAIHFQLDPFLANRVRYLSKEYGTTTYMILLSSLVLLFSKYSGQDDIVVGSLIAGRTKIEFKQIVGVFINTLALRNRVNPYESYNQFLVRVKEQSLQAYDNQDYSFEELIEDLNIQRDPSRNPLFDVLFSMESIVDFDLFAQDSIVIKALKSDRKVVNFDLRFIAREFKDEMNIEIEYATKLFALSTIERMKNHFIHILHQLTKNPNVLLKDITLLTQEEELNILHDFNNTEVPFTEEKTFVQLFEEQVQYSKEKIAAVWNEREMTYGELNEKANRLARVLRKMGVNSGSIVAIMVERSFDMLVGIFGIMKAGGAYLPIDPTYPEARINHIMKDSKSRILVSQSSLSSFITFSGPIVFVDKEISCNDDGENVGGFISPRDAAYVIYTSGSTGNPKGVMIEHRSLVNRLIWMQQRYPIQSEDTILQKTTNTFDVSVWEILWWSITGAKVYLLNQGDEKNVPAVIEAIHAGQITTMHFVPSMLSVFLDSLKECGEHDKLKSLKQVFTSGEALHVKQVQDFKDNISDRHGTRLINLYGPTEATIDVTYYECDEHDLNCAVPIGKPIHNTRLYIMDDYGALLPIGIPGQLYIGGVGVARGYVNNEHLTNEKFVPDPYLQTSFMYKTGDLAKWLPDGNIAYLGRLDHQVKLRGYRIELEEVEFGLLSHPAVKEAVVILKKDAKGDNYLCAYYVADLAIPVAELRELLLASLPEYMVPTYFGHLHEMPLSHNGKLDRRLLPEPDWGNRGTAHYDGPTTFAEAVLVDIWKEVLGVESVGIHDNFFELGGHSLKVALLLTKIHRDLSIEVPFGELFSKPTISEIGSFIDHGSKSVFESIKQIERIEYYETSSAQKRIFVLQQFDRDSTSYNMPEAIVLTGKLDTNKLRQSLLDVLSRHESFRTTFHMQEGEVVQVIHDKVDFELEYATASSGSLDILFDDFVAPFRLDHAPLLRGKLIQIHQEEYVLLLDMHHIISDGISKLTLIEEISKLYSGIRLPELTIQYKDFAYWHNNLLRSDRIASQENYWINRFSDDIPILFLPFEQQPTTLSYEGNRMKFILDSERLNNLNAIARETGSTLYMVLLAVVNILLAKYSGQDDIVVGTAVAGRRHAEVQGIIGMFVNTLAIRSFPVGDKSFADFLHEVKVITLQAFDNQDYPFEMLVEKVKVKRDIARNPLFDVMFTMHNMELDEVTVGDLQFKKENLTHSVTKFFLNFNVEIEQTSNEMVIEIEYSNALFTSYTIQGMLQGIENIIKSICSNRHIPISEIELLDEETKQKQVYQFNNTDGAFPQHTIQQSFELQTQLTPNHIAVVCGREQVTYKQLHERSNKLARLLREKGIAAGSIVGIVVERTIESIVGIVGIIKSGAAYLPIDPECPLERMQFMLEDSGAHLLLVQQGALNLSSISIPLLHLDNYNLLSGISEDPPMLTNEDSLVYMIYTSGTTGIPKGVGISNRSLANYVMWAKKEMQLHECDKTVILTSLAFDLSYTALYPGILSGCEIHILQKEEILNPKFLLNYVWENEITFLKLTPSLLHAIVNTEQFDQQRNESNRLRLIVLGGEKMNRADVLKVHCRYPEVSIMNHYGPTETTIGAIAHFIDLAQLAESNNYGVVGRPISNMQVYILDQHLQVVPIGVQGEICIAGEGLASGYRNNDDLTRDKFVTKLGLRSCEVKLYRTGDYGRILRDGSIEYIGRIDNQIKIRGYRVELEEIERQILSIDEIVDVAVLEATRESGESYLCAYIVAEQTLNSGQIRAKLQSKLPDYMIPGYWVQMQRLPLTPNGKTDRKALPSLDIHHHAANSRYEAPRNTTEHFLSLVWSEVLGINKIGIHDNFFELGGDSLTALRILGKLQGTYNVGIGDIFERQTINEFAPLLTNPVFSHHSRLSDTSLVVEQLAEFFQAECMFVHTTIGDENYSLLLVDRLEADILKYVQEQVHFNVLPHYVKKVNKEDIIQYSNNMQLLESDFNRLIEVQEISIPDMVRNSLQMINSQLEGLKLKLQNQERVEKYAVLPLQQYTLNYNAKIITEFEWSEVVDSAFLHKAIKDVFATFGLFRSVLVEAQGKLEWFEYAYDEAVIEDEDIPIIDLSEYDVMTQKIVLEQILSEMNRLDFGAFLHRFFVVKKNQKETSLQWIAHHGIFDGESSRILQKTLYRYYYNHKQQQANRILIGHTYREFVEDIVKSQQEICVEDVIRKYDIAKYNKYSRTASKVLVTVRQPNALYSMYFPISHEHVSFFQENVWKISFELFCVFCSEILNINEIPVLIYSYGRKFGNTYYDSIGEYIDVVPIVVDAHSDGMNDVRVIENIKLAATNKINFSNLILGTGEVNSIRSLIIPTGDAWGNTQLMFNFQGSKARRDKEKSEAMLKEQLEAMKGVEGDLHAVLSEGVTVNVAYSTNELFVSVSGLDTSILQDADSVLLRALQEILEAKTIVKKFV